MPQIGRGRRGDQQVVLNVVIPRNLTARQRELLDGAARQRHRGQPARGTRGVAALEGPAGAALIRLAVRAPAAAAEEVLAALLELAPCRRRAGRRRRRASSSPSTARRASCPSSAEGEAEVGGVRVVVSGTEVPDDWEERWKRFHSPVLVGGRL